MIFDESVNLLSRYIPEIEHHPTTRGKRSHPKERKYIEKRVKQISIYVEKYKSNENKFPRLSNIYVHRR